MLDATHHRPDRHSTALNTGEVPCPSLGSVIGNPPQAPLRDRFIHSLVALWRKKRAFSHTHTTSMLVCTHVFVVATMAQTIPLRDHTWNLDDRAFLFCTC